MHAVTLHDVHEWLVRARDKVFTNDEGGPLLPEDLQFAEEINLETVKEISELLEKFYEVVENFHKKYGCK